MASPKASSAQSSSRLAQIRRKRFSHRQCGRKRLPWEMNHLTLSESIGTHILAQTPRPLFGWGLKFGSLGKKFWVGYAERAANGVGATIHSQMLWVPNYLSFLVPTNITYQIPMQTVFGQGIAIPPGTPATLDTHVEMIRRTCPMPR
jgi:hypothetical protein